MPSHLLRCCHLQCTRPLWREGASQVLDATATFVEARFHAICGADGCGKNLLLHLLGLLVPPDGGSIFLGDHEVTRLPAAEIDQLRPKHFGFLFPSCALLPSLTVLENIAFPILKAGGEENEQTTRALDALRFCSLETEADHPVTALPAPRRAVVAFARAIAHRPPLLLAESPAAEETLAPLARRAVDELGLTVIWGARPGSPAAICADRLLFMNHGTLSEHIS